MAKATTPCYLPKLYVILDCPYLAAIGQAQKNKISLGASQNTTKIINLQHC